jgi:NitT/TauT family transport system substrate-binding protein
VSVQDLQLRSRDRNETWKRRAAGVAIVIVVMAGPILLGCAPPGENPSPETVTLAMGFVPNVQFAPFYVAVEKGYFADEGIQIEFDYGWETDLLKLVGSDELQFGVASGDQVILARSQDLPVVYVMNWYRRFPVCVVSLQAVGVKEPADLVGKRVGTPATYGASYIGWRALLDAAGLDQSEVELISIGYTQVAALTEGQVDAAICYAMNEPVQMRAGGQAIDAIYVADFANLVSNGLFTNEKTIRENPALVQGMVRAALRGLADTIERPDEAFEISLKYVPELAGDPQTETVNRAILTESIEFWRADPGELGQSSEADWQAALRVMQQMGLVEGDIGVDEMYTNEFVIDAEP